jgi:hypothetical protein
MPSGCLPWLRQARRDPHHLTSVTTQSSQRNVSSRRTQQRGAVPRIRFGLFAIHPEDVHRQRGGPAQRTEGHRIGTAQIRQCRAVNVIPRKCPALLLGFSLALTIPNPRAAVP